MNLYPWMVLAAAAGVTLLTRALPFWVFGGKKELPRAVQYLGDVLPAAIMAILVVFCLKGLPAAGGTEALFQIISLAAVAGLHFWKHNTQLSIFGGTVLYMVLIRLPIF